MAHAAVVVPMDCEEPMPHMTLQQRIDRAMVQRRLWFNRDPNEVRLHCWYGDSLLIDYFQRGEQEMSRAITSFVALHDKCKPQEQS